MRIRIEDSGNGGKSSDSPGKAKIWGYFPIDAHGRHGRLGPQLGHTLSHYDRILVPSEWAKSIVLKTLPPSFVDVLPHGIDTSIFYPRDKNQSRDKFGETLFNVAQWPKEPIDILDDALWVGIVATNQSRKDWGLGIEVVSELAKTRPVFLWAHSDAIKREWSLLELLSDFKLLQSTMLTVGNVSDESMALAYSAMDLTFSIDRGAGFNYPAFESIFCVKRPASRELPMEHTWNIWTRTSRYPTKLLQCVIEGTDEPRCVLFTGL